MCPSGFAVREGIIVFQMIIAWRCIAIKGAVARFVCGDDSAVNIIDSVVLGTSLAAFFSFSFQSSSN